MSDGLQVLARFTGIAFGTSGAAPAGPAVGPRDVLPRVPRYVAIALVTAAGSVAGDPDVGVLVLVATIVGLILILSAAVLFRRADVGGGPAASGLGLLAGPGDRPSTHGGPDTLSTTGHPATGGGDMPFA